MRIGADGVVHRVAGTGEPRLDVLDHPGGVATSMRVCYPTGVAVASDRSVYIADNCGKSLARVTPDGHLVGVSVDVRAFSVTAGPDGSVAVYDGRGGRIVRYDAATNRSTTLVSLTASRDPTTCDTFTGNGADYGPFAYVGSTLYFGVSDVGRVCALAPDGTITTIVGP